MLDQLISDLQILRKADLVIAKIWFNVLVHRFALMAFAGLIAVFGLGMANVAGVYALHTSLGAVWGAAIIALIDLAIAGVVLLVASKSRPGPELDLAFEVRKRAIESVRADARDLKLIIDSLGQEVKDVKENITHLVENPLDVAAQKLLIPAVTSILKGMRARK
jgi:hypothetical protein